MFKKKTVFVIGAGASAEFELPTGNTLKDQIASLLTNVAGGQNSADATAFRSSLIPAGVLTQTFASACRKLASTLRTFISIDEALHYFSADDQIVLAGKTALAHLIIRAEASSKLKTNRSTGSPDIGQCSNTWLAEFLSMALALIKREDVEFTFQDVTIINFNYDRVIEQYLFHALMAQAALRDAEAADTVNALNIIRPYGSVGKLGWQDKLHGIPFGGLGDGHDNPLQIGANILTYVEERDHTALREEIKAAIDGAHLVLFIGFGFHQQNMSLLRPFRENQMVYGTAFGIDKDNYGIFKELAERLGRSLLQPEWI